MKTGCNNKIFNTCKVLLICAFIIVWTMKKVAIFGFFKDSHYLLYAFAFMSLALMAYDVFTKRTVFKGKYSILLVVYMGICVLSSIVNIRYGITENIGTMIFMTSQMFLMYSSVSTDDTDLIKKEINIYGNVLIICFTVFTFILNLMYLMNLDIFCYNEDKNLYLVQGYSHQLGRSWGLFEHPATLIVGIVVFCFSIYYIYKTKKLFLKIIYSLVILINFVAMVLSGTRSVIYSMYVFAVLIPIFVIKRKSDDKIIKANLKRAGYSAVLLLASFLMVTVVNRTFPFIQSSIYNATSDKVYVGTCDMLEKVFTFNGYESAFTNISIDKKGEKSKVTAGKSGKVEELKRHDLEEKTDVTNSRVELWKDGIQFFKKVPIFGTSPKNMLDFAKDKYPKSDVAVREIELHDTYLDILVKSGILGFVVMGTFIILITIYIFKYLIGRNKYHELVGLFFSAFISFYVYLLVESDIVLHHSLHSFSFWIMLGITVALINNDYKSKDDKVKLESENK